MKKSIITEVLASARALDNTLDGESISIRVLVDKSKIMHSNALDPLMAIILNGVGEGHLESIKNPKNKIVYLSDVVEKDLCTTCFKSGSDLIECVSDWELLGSLKSFHILNKLANLEIMDIGKYLEDFDKSKLAALVYNFITVYSLYAETEIDYNYQVRDGRDAESVLNEIEGNAQKHLNTYHKNFFDNDALRGYFEKNLPVEEKELVSVVIGPLSQTSFWSEKPKADNLIWQEKEFAKNLLVVYCYEAIYRKTPCIMPLWVYQKIQTALPELIESNPHKIKSLREHETAKKLFEENGGDLFSSFDECFKCAELLEINPT
jgi:hypothetical protein